MPNYWILKSDPDTYGFDDLVRDGRTVWDGVSNAVALKNIRSMTKGDRLFIYHSGDEKAIVGLSTVVSAPYADPNDPKLTVVDIDAGERLPRPVTLSAVKADPAFAQLGLVRLSRLSVIPVPADQWRKLLAMAGGR